MPDELKILPLNIPKGYGFARIGSVMNYVTREAAFTTYAFDMAKLNKLGKIVSNANTTSVQSVQAHAYSTSSEDDSSSSTSTKAGFKTPLTRAALEHHTMKSNSKLDTTSGMSLQASMAYRIIDQDCHLKLIDNIDEAALYSCAEKDFRDHIEKIASAETPKEWSDAYRNFTAVYGHGFVSGLKLISCAFCHFEVTYATDGSKQQQQHGHSISGGRRSGGLSSAKQWAKEHTDNKAQGELRADVRALPEESPCAAWARDCMKQWLTAGLAQIAQDPPALPDKPTEAAKAPDLPDVPEPERKELPTVQLKSTDDMVRYMQLEQMNADGIDITKLNPEEHQKNWDDYQKDIEKKNGALSAKAIGKDGTAAKTKTGADPGTPDTAWPDASQPGVIAEPDAAAGPDNAFGQYAVYDIEVTAYKDAFKELLKWRFHAEPSLRALYLAKIHMFIMTRQLIGSYLTFLSSLPTQITGGWVQKEEAGVFAGTLTTYIDKVSRNEFAGMPIVSENSYLEVAGQFDKMLADNRRFTNGMGVYNCFVKNWDYLYKAPYGFLMTAKQNGHTFYPQWQESKDNPNWANWCVWRDSTQKTIAYNANFFSWPGPFNPFSPGGLAEVSNRLFPIVVGGDNPGINRLDTPLGAC
jgi:hypothetical protein